MLCTWERIDEKDAFHFSLLDLPHREMHCRYFTLLTENAPVDPRKCGGIRCFGAQKRRFPASQCYKVAVLFVIEGIPLGFTFDLETNRASVLDEKRSFFG